LTSQAFLQAANAEASAPGGHSGRFPQGIADGEYLSVGVHCFRDAFFLSVPFLTQRLDGLFRFGPIKKPWCRVHTAINTAPTFSNEAFEALVFAFVLGLLDFLHGWLLCALTCSYCNSRSVFVGVMSFLPTKTFLRYGTRRAEFLI
jgi:hypothetical protein